MVAVLERKKSRSRVADLAKFKPKSPGARERTYTGQHYGE